MINNLIYCSSIFSSQKLISICRDGFSNIIIVTDDNVEQILGQKLLNHLHLSEPHVHLISIPPGENSKSRDVKADIEDKMFALGCARDTLVIALGGGVVTDLAGFIAATFCRGIPVIYIPTTLLAMVDAAIGGKTGINTAQGKNLLGTFTNPHAIFMDVNLLVTLPYTEYIFAFSEIIKHALICDANYFNLLEDNIDLIREKDLTFLMKIIQRSCEIKSLVVLEDHKEKSKREILNFGHTIAHALEIVSNYTMQHGQAVALGIIIEAHIAKQMQLLAEDDFKRIYALISNLQIPLKFKYKLDKDEIIKAMDVDKKRKNGKNRFILLSKIGDVLVDKNIYSHYVELKVLKKALDFLFLVVMVD